MGFFNFGKKKDKKKEEEEEAAKKKAEEEEAEKKKAEEEAAGAVADGEAPASPKEGETPDAAQAAPADGSAPAPLPDGSTPPAAAAVPPPADGVAPPPPPADGSAVPQAPAQPLVAPGGQPTPPPAGVVVPPPPPQGAPLQQPPPDAMYVNTPRSDSVPQEVVRTPRSDGGQGFPQGPPLSRSGSQRPIGAPPMHRPRGGGPGGPMPPHHHHHHLAHHHGAHAQHHQHHRHHHHHHAGAVQGQPPPHHHHLHHQHHHHQAHMHNSSFPGRNPAAPPGGVQQPPALQPPLQPGQPGEFRQSAPPSPTMGSRPAPPAVPPPAEIPPAAAQPAAAPAAPPAEQQAPAEQPQVVPPPAAVATDAPPVPIAQREQTADSIAVLSTSTAPPAAEGGDSDDDSETEVMFKSDDDDDDDDDEGAAAAPAAKEEPPKRSENSATPPPPKETKTTDESPKKSAVNKKPPSSPQKGLVRHESASSIGSVDAANIAPSSSSRRGVSRRTIVDRFNSILLPQQCFGKVKKFTAVSVEKEVGTEDSNEGGEKSKSGVLRGNVVTLASRPDEPSLYYPQVMLPRPEESAVDSETGLTESVFLVHRGTTGNMAFAQSLPDADRILKQDGSTSDSCFVVGSGAILFKSLESSVKTIGKLTVVWEPSATTNTSSPSSSTAAVSAHDEVLDQQRQALISAALESKFGSKSEVINEIFSSTTRNSMCDMINERLTTVTRNVSSRVTQHQRATRANAAGRTAISMQFDLMISALQAKKAEMLSAFDSESQATTDNLAASIITEDYQMRLLDGAKHHLKSGSLVGSESLTTVSTALQMHVLPDSPHIQLPDRATLSSVENVLASVQGIGLASEAPITVLRSSGSPSKNQQGQLNDSDNSETQIHAQSLLSGIMQHDSVNQSDRSGKRRAASASRPTSRSLQGTLQRLASPKRLQRQSNSGTPTAVTSPADASRLMLSPSKRVPAHGAATTETCLFNTPLQQLVQKGKTVEWKLKIDDPGEWVGVGVGVGGALSSWASGTVCDMTHLWIVPRNTGRVLRLRVTESRGNAKLTIHDKNGAQLDDNRIPHWNISRPSFPQVSFGNRKGKVSMVAQPRVVV